MRLPLRELDTGGLGFYVETLRRYIDLILFTGKLFIEAGKTLKRQVGS